MELKTMLQKAYKNWLGKKRSDRIFVLVATAFPILQFLVFFVFVNFDCIFCDVFY